MAKVIPIPDIRVSGGGTIFLVTPVTQAGRDWINDNVAVEQMLGNGIAVEHRYVMDIVQGARSDGLVVS